MNESSQPGKSQSKSAEPNQVQSKPWYLQPRHIAIMCAAVIFLILILQNMESVGVQILFWRASAPAALIYIIFALAGFGAAWVTMKRKLKRQKDA